MKVLNKVTEKYKFDTYSEITEFESEEVKCSEYEVTKFSWAHKSTKKDDYYECTIEKTYYDENYFED